MDRPLIPINSYYGLKHGREDPNDSLENLEFKISEKAYAIIDQAKTAIRVIFRFNLKDRAYDWYQDQDKDVRSSCPKL